MRVIVPTVIPEPDTYTLIHAEAKLVPTMSIGTLVCPWAMVAGVAEVNVGAGLMRKQPVQVALPPPEVTVTSRCRCGASASTEIISVSSVELVNVTRFTPTPVPLTDTAASLVNPEPLSLTVRHDAP